MLFRSAGFILRLPICITFLEVTRQTRLSSQEVATAACTAMFLFHCVFHSLVEPVRPAKLLPFRIKGFCGLSECRFRLRGHLRYLHALFFHLLEVFAVRGLLEFVVENPRLFCGGYEKFLLFRRQLVEERRSAYPGREVQNMAVKDEVFCDLVEFPSVQRGKGIFRSVDCLRLESLVVVFPLPENPTKAVVFPSGIIILKFLKISDSP